MANKFDSDNYPTVEPSTLSKGDRWAWKRTDLSGDYATASYSLSYTLVKEGDPATKITINTSESGDDYIVEVAKSVTDDYKPGRYKWRAYITRTSDSERVEVDSGSIEITEDFVDTGVDPVSFWRSVYNALEPVILGRSKKEHSTYNYKGRSVTLMSHGEILELYNRARMEVRKEDNAERIQKGLGTNRKIQTRFINRQ